MNQPRPSERIDLMEYFTVLYKRRLTLALVTLLACALSIFLALRQKPSWTSVSRLLPAESKSEGPGLAGLAALAGFGMPQSASPETFYSDIIMSRDFLDTVIWMPWNTAMSPGKPLPLAQIYGMKIDSSLPGWKEKFRQKMHAYILKAKLVAFEREPSGLMTLTSSTIDPVLSFEMNSFLLGRLDEYNRLRKKTRTSEKKALIEERLREVEGGLKQSEERLRAFRERNISVSTPNLMLEQQRLLREVELNGALYQELRKQYEITKIEIVDNTQFLNVLESPTVPTIKGKSSRRKIVVIMTIFGFLAAAVGVLAVEKLAGFRARFFRGSAP